MSRFSDEQLDQARKRWDVVAAEVKLKRIGRELVGLCPWHSEKSPSFYVVPDKGFAFCFGCSWRGDPIDFIMQRRGLDFVEAVAELLGLPPQRPTAPLPPPRRDEGFDSDDNRQQLVEEILAGCTPIAGTPAEMYLSMRGKYRSVRQPDLLAHAGLQYVEDCDGPGEEVAPWRRWYSEKYETWRRGRLLPALIAKSTDSRDRVTALQRIWLADKVIYGGDGPPPRDNRAPVKTRKQALGTLGDGLVRLDPLTRQSLGIAEGIETAIAAADSYSFPVWSASGLARLGFPEHYRERVGRGVRPDLWIAPALPPRGVDAVRVPARDPTIWIPPQVTRLVIFGDRGIGEAVARHATNFYARKLGIKVFAALPPEGFSDFNDERLAELGL